MPRVKTMPPYHKLDFEMVFQETAGTFLTTTDLSDFLFALTIAYNHLLRATSKGQDKTAQIMYDKILEQESGLPDEIREEVIELIRTYELKSDISDLYRNNPIDYNLVIRFINKQSPLKCVVAGISIALIFLAVSGKGDIELNKEKFRVQMPPVHDATKYFIEYLNAVRHSNANV